MIESRDIIARVAAFTFVILQEPYDHAAMQGFIERINPIHDHAEVITGFIEHIRDDGIATQVTYPRFFDPALHATGAQTLSLWTQLESLFEFTYRGMHGEAFTKRKDWLISTDWSSYVVWWIADDHKPDWAEAYERHEHLYLHGSTPYAFDFKQPFNAQGEPVKIDKALARSLRHTESEG